MPAIEDWIFVNVGLKTLVRFVLSENVVFFGVMTIRGVSKIQRVPVEDRSVR
jgi:hypothetical protein